MYKIKNISKTFYKKDQAIEAVNNVSFEVEKGEIYGLIGLSGAGKSTLLRCLNFLEKPDSGEIYFENEALGSFSEEALRKKRQEIAMIFQGFNLFPSRTVFENVAMPLQLQNMDVKTKVEKVEKVLNYVGLSHRKNAYPKTLSGGEAQRVAIARALVSEPKVLLCDEPTSALDPQTTATILDLLKDLNRKLDLSIVLITHEMEVVEAICDKVAVLKEGRIVEKGKIEDVLLRMNDAETQKLLQIPWRIQAAKKKQKEDHKLLLVNERYADFIERKILNQVLDLKLKDYHTEQYVSYLLQIPEKKLEGIMNHYDEALYCEVI